MTLLEQYMADYQRVCAEKQTLQRALDREGEVNDGLNRYLSVIRQYAYDRSLAPEARLHLIEDVLLLGTDLHPDKETAQS